MRATPRPLIRGRQYEGQYVAVESYNNTKVIAANKDPLRVVAEAERKGFADPLIVYVPPKGVISIY
jgi:hypothetical protein